MITIDDVDSDVVVEPDGPTDGGSVDPEALRDEIREVVRQIVREELERYLRTEARR